MGTILSFILFGLLMYILEVFGEQKDRGSTDAPPPVNKNKDN
jgi:hypothetical protein